MAAGLDHLDDVHVGDVELADVVRLVVDDVQRPAVGRDRHAPRCLTGRNAGHDRVGGEVDLDHLTGAVECGVQVLAGGVHDEVARSAPDAADVSEVERREVELRDVARPHHGDVRGGRLRVDRNPAWVGADGDPLHLGVRGRVDHADVVRAPVAHDEVPAVGRDGEELGRGADRDRRVDCQLLHVDPVDVAAVAVLRREARVVARMREPGAVHRVVRDVHVAPVGCEGRLDRSALHHARVLRMAERREVDGVGDRGDQVEVAVVDRDRVLVDHVLREHQATLRGHHRLRRDRPRDVLGQPQRPGGRRRAGRRGRRGQGRRRRRRRDPGAGGRVGAGVPAAVVAERDERAGTRRQHDDQRAGTDRQPPGPRLSPVAAGICPGHHERKGYSGAVAGTGPGVRPGEELLDGTPAREAHEREVCVRRIPGRGPVPLPVHVVAGPRPSDDRPFRYPREEVAEGLAVAVPELPPQGRPTDGSRHDLTHDEATREVEPDHRVGACPDEVADHLVVAVDHPPFAGAEPRHLLPEVVGRKLRPRRQVEDGVELERGARSRSARARATRVLPDPELPTTDTRCTAPFQSTRLRRRGASALASGCGRAHDLAGSAAEPVAGRVAASGASAGQGPAARSGLRDRGCVLRRVGGLGPPVLLRAARHAHGRDRDRAWRTSRSVGDPRGCRRDGDRPALRAPARQIRRELTNRTSRTVFCPSSGRRLRMTLPRARCTLRASAQRRFA